MGQRLSLLFKIATEDLEFEQIHRLNYETFVEEIPQHYGNGSRILIDKFHKENTYVICKCNGRVVGMMAIRGTRPFSLDQKLDDLDQYIPPGRSVCEIRLLAVDKDYRAGRVFYGLARKLSEYGLEKGYDMAVISGTTRQQKLYRHIGFVPFGPLVGKPGALFQPMYLTLENIQEKAGVLLPGGDIHKIAQSKNYLPGPVNISEEVQQAFNMRPVSHRSRMFMSAIRDIKDSLCSMVSASRVELFVGSGTLANDVVAGQISLLEAPGLVISNGEFGRRLIDHATRQGLKFQVFEKEWGDFFTMEDIQNQVRKNPSLSWMWAVHCETSTSVLNDMNMLKSVCGENGIKLCLDATSSIGAVPVDLRGVYLASSVSGKALGSFPGLSMVFYHHDVEPAADRLPRYLDLGTYAACNGVPYTHSSNLLFALGKALEGYDSKSNFEDLRDLSFWLRARLRGNGFHLVAPDEHVSPAVVTIALPEGINSEKTGDRLEEEGYLISYRSRYLLDRNWIQICIMGEISRSSFIPLLDRLREICFGSRPGRPARWAGGRSGKSAGRGNGAHRAM